MNDSVTSKLECMGKKNMTISIVYGPCKGNGTSYSVTVLNGETGEAFEKPYLVTSMEHAIDAAYLECVRRNWIDPNSE